jgi:DNA-binding NarL/FixJ family response regulator
MVANLDKETLMNIRVFIADDHPIAREGIRSAIERTGEGIGIIGEASNGKEVLGFPQKSLVDVYILDIVMPKLNGIDTSIKLLKLDPKSKIIMLSIHDSRSFVMKALRSGAKGYVLKENAIHDLIQAIQKVHLGHFFFSPVISEIIVEAFLSNLSNNRETDKPPHLNKRERKILTFVGRGNSNYEMARKLDLPLNGVNALRENVLNKLGIQTQSDLVRLAIAEDIPKL